MAYQDMALPLDIPWKLVAVSPDMMDTTFGNKAYPFAFRSSLAISAYEPDIVPSDADPCPRGLLFLKVSATITGYQATKEETDRGYVIFPDVPTERLTQILDEYLACYGVMLNIAVFPHSDTIVEQKTTCLRFDALRPGVSLANPYVDGDVSFDVDRDRNMVVDSYPSGGNGSGELDLGQRMAVTLPTTGRVTTKVALREPAPVPRPRCLSFADVTPGGALPNPYPAGDVTFEAQPGKTMKIVDQYPDTPDGRGELSFEDGMSVRLPASSRVTARLVSAKGDPKPRAVSMTAYSAGTQVGSATTPADAGVEHGLEVAGQGIDQVVFSAGPKGGLLLELCWYVPTRPAVEGVTLYAYRGDELVSASTSPSDLGVPHTLEAQGEGIDKVILESPAGNASLLELCREVPVERAVVLSDYPHIIDFEPKIRDLYQAATQNGEILTASVSGVKTDKTRAHTETTETGLELGSKYTSPPSPYGQAEVNGKISHKWGTTDQDSFQVQADASRNSRETQGTSTNISQMYNLLTGYHQGTNRASFIMLPRPHMLQPTDRRTFAQGLRIIEGVQEFFLVVEHPTGMPGLCVEALLETGHFPETVTKEEPPAEQWIENTEEFTISLHANNGGVGGLGGETKKIEDQPTSVYTISSPWTIDRTKGDPSHGGISEIANNSNNQANTSLTGYDYRATSDTSVQVFGTIYGAPWWGPGAIFNRTYQVHTRKPKPADDQGGGGPKVTTKFLITSRSLSTCLRTGSRCLEPLPLPQDRLVARTDSVVDEQTLPVAPVLLEEQPDPISGGSATKDLLRQIHQALARSWRMPSRRPPGVTGLLETDHVKERIARLLPEDRLRARLADTSVPESVREGLGANTPVTDALALPLPDFARRTGLPVDEAVRARLTLLGDPTATEE
ncbi:hypothetical protein [Micromonospora sp. NPDC005806]|uniref:hypothetical protein n=1 Tax=Micromonospora sp. NPDC005806 TaxID=3364234 RepID=UPI00367A7EA4